MARMTTLTHCGETITVAPVTEKARQVQPKRFAKVAPAVTYVVTYYKGSVVIQQDHLVNVAYSVARDHAEQIAVAAGWFA